MCDINNVMLSLSLGGITVAAINLTVLLFPVHSFLFDNRQGNSQSDLCTNTDLWMATERAEPLHGVQQSGSWYSVHAACGLGACRLTTCNLTDALSHWCLGS